MGVGDAYDSKDWCGGAEEAGNDDDDNEGWDECMDGIVLCGTGYSVALVSDSFKIEDLAGVKVGTALKDRTGGLLRGVGCVEIE